MVKFGATMMIIFSVIVGFGLIGCSLDVRKTFHKPKKLSIFRGQNTTVIIADGRIFNYDTADWYNTKKEDFKRLMIENEYNSYGFNCNTRPLIMEPKDIKKALTEK